MIYTWRKVGILATGFWLQGGDETVIERRKIVKNNPKTQRNFAKINDMCYFFIAGVIELIIYK